MIPKSDIEKMFGEDPAQMPLDNSDFNQDGGEIEPENKVQDKKNHQDRRWDKLFNKLEETQEKLSEYEKFKTDVETGRIGDQKAEIPEHFKKMYADGLTLEERWEAQQNYERQREADLLSKAQDGIIKAQRAEKEQQEKWEDFIDQKLEILEEKHGVDFTSGTPRAERMKRDFLSTVRELSEDENGNIEKYASFDKSFELWSKSKNLGDTSVQQKKNISGLASQRSTPAPQKEDEPGEGGMWGWMKYVK